MLRKIGLFLSAFVPMYMLVIIKMIIDIAEGNEEGSVMVICVMILLMILVLIGVSCVMYVFFSKRIAQSTIQIDSANNVTGQYFFGYFSLFVLVAVHLELYTVCDIILFFLINIIIAIVYIHNNLYYINPLLNLIGYNIYKITYIKDGQQKNINIFVKDKLDISNKVIAKSMFNYNFCIDIE
ncbi:MAG: hypothetical protein IJW28_03845 [Clostridia bacterium]|nr:hypothetical protein [Clostridia bacterium]